jgi:hypothetical protein
MPWQTEAMWNTIQALPDPKKELLEKINKKYGDLSTPLKETIKAPSGKGASGKASKLTDVQDVLDVKLEVE